MQRNPAKCSEMPLIVIVIVIIKSILISILILVSIALTSFAAKFYENVKIAMDFFLFMRYNGVDKCLSAHPPKIRTQG